MARRRTRDGAGVELSSVAPSRPRQAVLLACLITLAGIFSARTAEASTAANGITVMAMGNDLWYNYDFNSESHRSTNVDWAISVLFINNATIDKAKSKVDDWTNAFEYSSSTRKWSYTSNYYERDWGWDADRGKKNPICPVHEDSHHFRAYSNNNGGYERMYNTTLGFYVIASTHRDWDECGGSVRHGYSEYTESVLLNRVRDNTYVEWDKWGLSNNENYRVEGNHIWSNDGWASTVRIP
jgi:hypothetical protein